MVPQMALSFQNPQIGVDSLPLSQEQILPPSLLTDLPITYDNNYLPGVNYFKWGEVNKNFSRYVPIKFRGNCVKLGKVLDSIREDFDSPININSWYRDPLTNKKVGGKENSWHIQCLAADFVVKGYSTRQVQKYLLSRNLGGTGYYPSWNHIDLGPVRHW